MTVPAGLRYSFLVHFAVDILIAVPVFIAPREVLTIFGWERIDPIAARLVAAALFAIGLESFLGRNSSIEAYRGMLQLKLLWSAFAAIGVAWSVIQGGLRYEWIGWSIVAIFVLFHFLWWYWYLKLRD